MTAPQQPEPGKHCGHECVCMSFSYNKLQKFARPCVIDTCQHDTRQRNVPEGERMYAITESDLLCIKMLIEDNANHDDEILDIVRNALLRPLSDMCMERNGAQGQQP